MTTMDALSATTAAASILASPDPRTWVFLGDSVTAGSWHTWGGRSYSELFEERLRELGRSRDAVINTAVPGWYVTDLAPQLDALCVRFAPDVVFINFGLNDARLGLAGLDDFAESYENVMRRVQRDTGATVMMMTPNRTLPSELPAVVEFLPAYVERIRELATELGIPLIDHYAEWMAAPDGAWFHWLGHGCHPNASGHRAMARTLMQELGIWDSESRSGHLMIPK